LNKVYILLEYLYVDMLDYRISKESNESYALIT